MNAQIFIYLMYFISWPYHFWSIVLPAGSTSCSGSSCPAPAPALQPFLYRVLVHFSGEWYLEAVFVSSGCNDKIPFTRYLLLIVLKGGKSKIQVTTDLGSGENLLSGLRTAALSLCSYMVERERALVCLPRLLRTLIPSQGPYPHDLI